jgi:hypothetical protein
MSSEKKTLVLLIGTNPLPNYVVARLLENDFENILLIYSKEANKGVLSQKSTYEYCRNLKSLFTSNSKFFELGLSDISSAHKIAENLKDFFDNSGNSLKKSDCIHLNYTGGTKTMAVHVYLWLLTNFDKQKLEFSYLDPRNYRLVDDNASSILFSNLLEDSNNTFSNTTIEKLLYLHGYELISGIDIYKTSLGIYGGYINKLQTYSKTDLESVNKRWKSFYYQYGNKKSKLKKVLSLNSSILTTLTGEPFDSFRNDMIGFSSLSNDEFSNLIDFIDGNWLEYYVFNCLPTNIVQKGISLKAQRNGIAKKFELDVFALKAYQLFAISVTTSADDKGDESKIKQKCFEVLHRANQIGGEEAKAIMFCPITNNKAKIIKEDILNTAGVNEDKFHVIGIDDWESSLLKNKLDKIING